MMYSRRLLRTAAVLLLSAALVVPAQASASAQTVVHTAAASPVSHVFASTKAFSKAPVPKVTGVGQVGKVITAVAGTWKSKPTTLRYQWMRNGKPIAHATGRAYKLVAADGGTRVGVVVTGTRPGYKTTSRTSAVTVIALASFIRVSHPIVYGEVRYGHTLRVYLDAWTPAPIASYQWKSAGKPIAGATRASYTIAKTDVGHQITVTVTGKRPGYKTVLATSVGTQRVPAIVPPAAGMARDGEYLVGVDVIPGTYVARSSGVNCSWYRLGRDTDYDYLGQGAAPGQAIVTIAASDVYFQTDGCGSWVPIADVPFTVMDSITVDGELAVHAQVIPGVYTTTNPFGGCLWETYSDFSGSDESYVDGGYSYDPTVVATINPTDAAFETDGCGTWTRISD
ncbi:hypothetical protein [Glaciihabitans sp. dw_435]|uniref:hypothetical protein n=1 Tax=Glaciihabitans sp. dw_435 TaxID=2720081 RepID=UPI001BD4F073|nr:hypothetical protein [Glaciihabitans sp. dw_435]